MPASLLRLLIFVAETAGIFVETAAIVAENAGIFVETAAIFDETASTIVETAAIFPETASTIVETAAIVAENAGIFVAAAASLWKLSLLRGGEEEGKGNTPVIKVNPVRTIPGSAASLFT